MEVRVQAISCLVGTLRGVNYSVFSNNHHVMKVKLCNGAASPRSCGPGWSLDLGQASEEQGMLQAQGSTYPLASGDMTSSLAVLTQSALRGPSFRACLERKCKV